LERNGILEEELGQLQGTALSVVTEILGPRPKSRALVADLSEIPGEMSEIITDGVLHGTSRVLMSVVSQYPTLDFGAIGRGYAAGWSADQLYKLEQSLEPVATVIAKMTTAMWVKEARCCADREAALGGNDGQPIEAELGATPTEPAPVRGSPAVDPAARLLLSTSSVNTNEVPQ
jgi:hypothetical protein